MYDNVPQPEGGREIKGGGIEECAIFIAAAWCARQFLGQIGERVVGLGMEGVERVGRAHRWILSWRCL